jgi:hypothetical protein
MRSHVETKESWVAAAMEMQTSSLMILGGEVPSGIPDSGRRNGRERGGHLLDHLGGLGAVVETHPTVGDALHIGDLGVGVGGELVGEDDVGGQDELDALGGRLLLELLGELDLVSLDERAAQGNASVLNARYAREVLREVYSRNKARSLCNM